MYALVEPVKEILPSESFNKSLFDHLFRELATQENKNSFENGYFVFKQ